MPKKAKGLVTGLLADLRPAGKPGKPGKTRRTTEAEKPPAPRRTIKTVRVDPAVWGEARRYALRRQAKGEAVSLGDVVEAAIREYVARHRG